MRPFLLALSLALAVPAVDAAAQAPAQVAVPQQVVCRGERPYWQLDVTRQTGVLRRAGGKVRQRLDLRGELSAFEDFSPKALVWRGSSTHLPAEVVVMTARELACTPGGDVASGWQAIVSPRAGEALAGCCVVRRGYDAAKAPIAAFAQKPDDDWARRWPEIGAAVQRCVTDAGVAVREVATARSAEDGTVAVRMTAADGSALACTIAANARGKPTVVAASGAPPPGANAPVYYPAREIPIVACGRLERIAAPGPRARTEGWLHYERC
jgi:hypothetical protein